MPNSLRSKISKLRYKRQISDEEYRELTKKLNGHDKELLDKIKAEIEQKCCITVGQENEPAITLYDVFQIIDKAESEVQDEDSD